MARTRAALTLAAAAVLAALAVSGGSSSDPRTPAALAGLPPPFLTTAVLGDGGLNAGVDAYGDIVDLRAGPAGPALIENPLARQEAGTVPADTGIVPRVSVAGGPRLPLWRADSVSQRYLPGTDALRTTASFGDIQVSLECAAHGAELGCVSDAGDNHGVRISFARNLNGGDRHVHLDDPAAPRIVTAAVSADRRWLGRARPLGNGAPAWARRLYGRSLLVLRALSDRSSGVLAAGARDGWAYVWPRDAGAGAIALAAAGYQHGRDGSPASYAASIWAPPPASTAGATRFRDALLRATPWGWTAAAARAAGLPAPPGPPPAWRDRPDYQEKSPGDYLANALASGTHPVGGPEIRLYGEKSAHRHGFGTQGGLVREAGEPGSGLDSAAAWAVRPFPDPALFPKVRTTLTRLLAHSGRFGIVPSENWPDDDPWTAPTAWSAWSLAALASDDSGATAAARDRAAALSLLADLRRASTPAGLLPERVGARSGMPVSTTPLAWSHAFAILAIRQLWPGRRQRDSQ